MANGKCAEEQDEPFRNIWAMCQPFTMTSFDRGLALFRGVRYIVENRIPGDFVECGVWKGGSSMIAMLTLRHFKAANRRFFLFDTFQGMTEPTDVDIDVHSQPAKDLLCSAHVAKETVQIWAHSPINDVRNNIERTEYPPDLITFVEGDVRNTAPVARTKSPANSASSRGYAAAPREKTRVAANPARPRLG